MPNPYLSFTNASEQDLTESLITEAIKIHAEKFYYIPKTLVSADEILGEDRLAQYKTAYPVDMYMENATNLDGQMAFIQRFGGFLDYSATLLVSRSTWHEAVGRYGATILPNRPTEGDLVYFPLTDGLFVIKYVDDKNPFAQLGAFYTWKLTVELWQYSSEQIETGVDDIDAFESLKTFDQLNGDRSTWQGVRQVILEDGGAGYTETPYIHVRSRSGSGALFAVKMTEDGSSIAKVDVVESGEGYQSTDTVEVIGNCERPARLRPIIRTKVENAGDRWGDNEALEIESDKALEEKERLFGDALPVREDNPPPEPPEPTVTGFEGSVVDYIVNDADIRYNPAPTKRMKIRRKG